jgi:hypothetical protein
MTPDEIREAFAEAKAESLETLERTADIEVERSNHDDDGFLSPWSKGMPKKPPPVTAAEVGQMIAAAMADIDGRIAAAFETRAWERAASTEAIGMALAETRKKMRAEFQEQLGLLRADIEVTNRTGGQRHKDAHSDWMDECVPSMMDKGKDQTVAVAACLNMWRQAWEESHPDGSDDPGPPRPEKAGVIDLPSILPTQRQRHG